MLSDLLYGFRGEFRVFNVFHYITFRAALGALSSFLACYLLLPRWIAWFHRRGLGQVIRSDGPSSHRPKAGTPTMGGLVVVGAVSGGTLLFARPDSPLVWLAQGALLWFGGIGAVDDWLKLREQHSRGLPASSKLFWQFLGALALALACVLAAPGGFEQGGIVSLPFLKRPVLVPVTVYLGMAMVVMVGTSNAVNLTDGLDGLAAGCMVFAAGGLALVAYLTGNLKFSTYLRIPFVPGAGELAVMLAIVVGGCLGFLWYNAPPAQVFMGDVGALALGGLLGAAAVFIKAELLLLIFGGAFVVEALSVLAQVGFYKLRRRRILLMAPLHHHFELRGVPESKVIVRFWILSGLMILSMLLTLKLR